MAPPVGGGLGARPPPSLSDRGNTGGRSSQSKRGSVTVLAVADKAGCYRPQKEPCGWRGPALGGVYLRIGTAFSQITLLYRCRRGSPTAVLVMARALGRIEPEGTYQERSENSILIKRNRYRSANFCPFLVDADRRRCRDGVTAAFRSKTRWLLALPRPW